jgi:tRNA 2-selenouridine synthase
VSPNFYQGDLLELLLSSTPLIDLRAPVEFNQGSLPNATNLPILDDQQRAKVGTCYKQSGQEAAIRLGEQLISGEVLDQRTSDWKSYLERYPNAVSYCFRGGLRSQKAQALLRDLDIEIPIIEGGYKLIRNLLIQQMEQLGSIEPLLVLAGETGSDKTGIINSLSTTVDTIDLEGLAAHRGSAFGNTGVPLPTQINFEHALTMELLRLKSNRRSTFTLIEDESQRIGNCSLAHSFYQHKQLAPTFRLIIPLEERVSYTRTLYVESWWQQLSQELSGEQLNEKFYQQFAAPLERIKKRLGGAKYQEAMKLLDNSMEQQAANGDFSAHDDWIHLLLKEYYDPLYLKTIQQKRVVGQGNRQEFLSFIQSWHQ